VSYDLGDVISLAVTVRDADGDLADAGAMALTVTAPDASTASPAVTRASLGTYTADYAPTVAGRFTVQWTATGANAGVMVDAFEVLTAADAIERAETAARVAAKSRVSLPDQGTADRDSLDAAVADATALVMARLRRDTLDTLAGYGADAVRAVIVRVAARFWRNPQDLSGQSYDGMSISVSEPRVLTGDEQAALAPWVARKRGTIFLNPLAERVNNDY
jgi:hypothetical protein